MPRSTTSRGCWARPRSPWAARGVSPRPWRVTAATFSSSPVTVMRRASPKLLTRSRMRSSGIPVRPTRASSRAIEATSTPRHPSSRSRRASRRAAAGEVGERGDGRELPLVLATGDEVEVTDVHRAEALRNASAQARTRRRSAGGSRAARPWAWLCWSSVRSFLADAAFLTHLDGGLLSSIAYSSRSSARWAR